MMRKRALKQGINTAKIGKQLIKNLDMDSGRYGDLEVHYDHGDSKEKEVCQPTGYIGRQYGNDATLTFVDIVVTKGDKIKIAIEVEESEVRPKTIIGDVFGIVLSDKFRIQDRIFKFDNTNIIIALVAKSKGKSLKKYERLQRRMERYFENHPMVPGKIKGVKIITCPLEDITRRVERLIRLEVGKI